MSISLSTIVAGRRLKAPKVLIYGVGGIGKTTWAADAPDPIFLFTEEGQGALDVQRFEPRPNDPVLRTWEELIECLAALHGGEHEYKTVVIDSIDFAEPLLHTYTSRRHNKEDIEEFGYGKGYVYAVDEARELTRWLDVLRNDRGMAVIVIGHCDTKKFNSPELESYDRYKLSVQDRLAEHMHNWADAVLFCNYRTTVVKDSEGGPTGKDKRERTRGVGMGERIMYTEERPAWRAKNRYKLPYELPLLWSAFQDAVGAGSDESSD